MSNNINLLMKYILSELFKADNYLYVFTLSKRLRMDVYTIESSIKVLISAKYVARDAEDEFKVRITQTGIDWLQNMASFTLDGEKNGEYRPLNSISIKLKLMSTMLQ